MPDGRTKKGLITTQQTNKKQKKKMMEKEYCAEQSN